MMKQTADAARLDEAWADRREFRADVDHSGRWCVWQRLGCGWAVWASCRSRSDAIERAAELNRMPAPGRAG